MEKTRKYLKAYINNDYIFKPKYRVLNENEKQVLANVLLDLKNNNNELYIFFKKIILSTNKANLRNLGNNIQTLKIHKENKNKLIMLLKNDVTVGKYRLNKNEIFIFNNRKSTINHELLHVSSSNPFYNAVGFNIIFDENNDLKYNEIGRGLNEGYTELLNNRIFNNRSYSYILLNKISYLIELLFESKDEMKDYYFNNDIEGIIYELNKYINDDEIIDLLFDIDELYYCKNILLYLKIKKKLLKIYEQNKSESEIYSFRKIYHQNHIMRIIRKTL